jgi:hypothetical protein
MIENFPKDHRQLESQSFPTDALALYRIEAHMTVKNNWNHL